MQVIVWATLDTLQRNKILQRSISKVGANQELTSSVASIISQVKIQGDSALFKCAQQFDNVNLDSLEVSVKEYQAIASLDQKSKNAIITAAENIHHFHQMSCPKDFEYEKNGINLGKMYRPIEKVGLYIPGGTAPLVSTLLMLAIPAQIAGCQTKILVTPPQVDGKISPAILFAAKHCGIETIYKAGGAQAIAALAFGTQTIPKVYKIFGPGNKYVTEAKLQVSKDALGAAIDMPAGPSEVLVIADDKANPAFIASDLLAQAEHDKEAQVILVTTSKQIVNQVLAEIEVQINYLSRKQIIHEALNHSRIILANSINECFSIANSYAPEHLILHIKEAKSSLAKVVNAGSVFVGQWSPESVGDYASGTNHVLPTHGYARMYSGLDVMAFMKSISFQHLTLDGLKYIGETVESLAELEGLDAHKNAVSLRLKSL